MPKGAQISLATQTPLMTDRPRDRTASITGPQPVDVSYNLVLTKCISYIFEANIENSGFDENRM